MTAMRMSECKKFMRGYREMEDAGIIKFNWRTTARWSLRHQWEHEENGNLRRELAAAITRAERAEAALHLRGWCDDPGELAAAIARAERAEKLAEDRAFEASACHDIMAECRNIAGEPHNSTVDAVRGLLARALAAEAALAQCREWRQEDADNLYHCIRAKQKLLDDRSMLRRALAQLVRADTTEELRNMEMIIRSALAPAQDKAAAIDAIHALIEVQP